MVNGASRVKGICILGATGSIGVNTLDVAARHPEKYKIIALSANSQVERLAEQCEKYQPEYAVMVDEDSAEQLKNILNDKGLNIHVLSGVEGLEKIASLHRWTMLWLRLWVLQVLSLP